MKRQKFYSDNHFKIFLKAYDDAIEFYRTRKFQSDSVEEEEMLRARFFQRMSLNKLLASYTAGVAIPELSVILDGLVSKYEEWQSKLEINENICNISPLAIGDYVHQYEECVQVIGFCVLLHRTDLLKRFVALIDNAGYEGTDTLYEDLLSKLISGRHDIDQWYHDVYSPLVQAIYSNTKEEAADHLKKYCNQWYAAFRDAPWHDTHHQGEDGSYVGYWAIEAGAIAFLYGIDDSKIDHMVYPKDLVEYARKYQPTNNSQVSRIDGGQPCSRTGYWFTPAKSDSRQHFQQGETMPKFSDSKWGETIWYWSGEE